MKRVLLVTSELLLRQGIVSLLSREVDINVLSINYVDEKTLIHEIDQYNPDVVILDERMEYRDLTKLFDVLIDHPRIRMMVVNVIDNKVNVYDKSEFEISHSYDLISAIRQGSAFVSNDVLK